MSVHCSSQDHSGLVEISGSDWFYTNTEPLASPLHLPPCLPTCDLTTWLRLPLCLPIWILHKIVCHPLCLYMSDHVRHPLSSCSLFLRVQSCYDVTWPVILSSLSPTLSSHVGSRHQINDSVSHSLSVSLSLSLQLLFCRAPCLPADLVMRWLCIPLGIFHVVSSLCFILFPHVGSCHHGNWLGGMLPSKKLDPILVPQEAVWILLSTGIALPGTCCWLPFCRKSRRRSPGSNLGWLHSSRLASILQLTHLATD